MKKKLLLQDLADYLVQHDDIGKRNAGAFVRAFFEVIEQGLLEDNFVKIKGFGTFKLVAVSDRESVNISTGERFQISGHTKVTFTPDAKMKELVNRPFQHFETVDLSDETDMAEFEEIDMNMAIEDDVDLSEESESVYETQYHEAIPILDYPDSEQPDEKGVTLSDESGEPQNAVDSHADETSVNDLFVTENKKETDVAAEEQSDEVVTDVPTPLVPDIHEENTSDEFESNTETVTLTRFVSVENDAMEPEVTEADNEVNEGVNTGNDTRKPEQNPFVNEVETNENATFTAVDEDADVNVNAEDEIHVTAPRSITTSHAENRPCEGTPNTMAYSYVEVPSKPKRNWWKVAMLMLCQMLIMAVCYFVGYYRLLCPCSYSYLDQMFGNESVRTDNVTQVASKNVVQPDSSVKDNATAAKAVGDTVRPNVATNHNNSAKTQEAKGAEAKATETKKASEEMKSSAANNEANQRPKFHVVKVGDNLSKISRRYYGTDKMVPAIVKYNKLKDANNVHLGMNLKLP